MQRTLTMMMRVALTLATALLVFTIVAAVITTHFVIVPVSRRAADDFAALIMLTAQTWVELPPATRPVFEQEAWRTHGLNITTTIPDEPLQPSRLSHWAQLEDALSGLSGSEVRVMSSSSQSDLLMVQVTVGGRVLGIGFDRERIAVRLPTAITFAIIAGLAISLLAAVILARRLNTPLRQLADAAKVLGAGGRNSPLPEPGPRELNVLVRRFNHMAEQVDELLSNRTTLLAGISHDLRSPLTRLNLALEMLPDELDPELVRGMRRDTREMEQLIGRVLELARGLEAGEESDVNIRQSIGSVVDEVRGEGTALVWDGNDCCDVAVCDSALRRILFNLIDNARRYAGGSKIDIRCECAAGEIRLAVLDRGPGIPADAMRSVFRPFFRLESSRNRATGGSGLGLAIVRQICSARGWSCRLRNRAGGGLVAELLIPVSNRVPSSKKAPASRRG